ncbi:MAG: hypothetical protein P8Z35_21140 [Ignavibacteriaceae bacterium]
MKKNIAYYFIAIIIINAIGILLRYLELDTYFILIGFRLLFAILFLLRKIEPGAPDYFYEFGISSITDFPVYLAWNSIQLILFFLFFIYLTSKVKLNLLIIFFIFFLLFVYELIPLKKESFNYFDLISVFLSGLMVVVMVKYYQNIYWLVIFSFSILWLDFLLFGSNSEMAVNLLFASQYNSWEGFFSVEKDFKVFVLPAHLILANILILSKFFKEKSNFKINYADTGNY